MRLLSSIKNKCLLFECPEVGQGPGQNLDTQRPFTVLRRTLNTSVNKRRLIRNFDTTIVKTAPPDSLTSPSDPSFTAGPPLAGRFRHQILVFSKLVAGSAPRGAEPNFKNYNNGPLQMRTMAREWRAPSTLFTLICQEEANNGGGSGGRERNNGPAIINSPAGECHSLISALTPSCRCFGPLPEQLS